MNNIYYDYEKLTESDVPDFSVAKVKPLTPSELFAKAHKAGMQAGNDITPTPMTVVGGGRSYFVGEGVCGFASIVIKPARGKFVQWLKANKNTYKHYYGGIAIFVGEFGQSLTRKEAYASAFVKVLASAGLNAHVDSRMD
jgi:hypothetical protein